MGNKKKQIRQDTLIIQLTPATIITYHFHPANLLLQTDQKSILYSFLFRLKMKIISFSGPNSLSAKSIKPVLGPSLLTIH